MYTKFDSVKTLKTLIKLAAEELASALARQPQRVTADPAPTEDNAAEAKYGAKLNKMMGELQKLQD